MPKRAFPVAGSSVTLDVRPDRLDLRDRPFVPQVRSLPAQWPSDADAKRLFPAYAEAGLILNQGKDGACTGFGLAAVVNYALWVRSVDTPLAASFTGVSPYMLYDLARFYDEWPGQDYEGSSCRGALKGWHKHGVCRHDLWTRSIYPAVSSGTGKAKPRSKGPARWSVRNAYAPDAHWPDDAATRPIGVYYRIDRQSITDLQAAIVEAEAIYVSCSVHQGWDVSATRRKTLTHASLPRIAFDAMTTTTNGGHAFALVGFNSDGFVVQNSWGTDWGQQGFAVLHYEDWITNGTDAWVCALGVPQNRNRSNTDGARATVQGQRSHGRVMRQMSGSSLLSGDPPLKVKPNAQLAQPWSMAQALAHSIVAGNDGMVSIGRPDQALPEASVAHAVQQFADWAATWRQANPDETPKLAIYAHGGLNGEATALERVRVLGPYFLENGVYPLFYIWKTGVQETLQQEAEDRRATDPYQHLAAGKAGEAWDRLLESLAHGPFQFLWRQMKQNAEAAKAPDRALGLLLSQLHAQAQIQAFEIHLIGHSAGAFITGHLLAMGVEATSLSLFAPACPLTFALEHIAPNAPVGKTAFHLLTTHAEANDTTGWKPPLAYGKSLLWWVCRGFEDIRKTPLAGLAHAADISAQAHDDDLWHEDAYPVVEQWRDWIHTLAPLPNGHLPVRETAEHCVVREPPKIITGTHGGFDNDITVITQTLTLITGLAADDLAVKVQDLNY